MTNQSQEENAKKLIEKWSKVLNIQNKNRAMLIEPMETLCEMTKDHDKKLPYLIKSQMTNEQIANLITPEFILTLKTVLNHLSKCPNKLGLDWNEIDFLPGVMNDLVTGEYYKEQE